MRLSPATRADVPAIQRLFELDPEYFARVDQAPIRTDEGEQTLIEVPPEFPHERKHVFVVRGDGALDAVIDLLEGYPDRRTWFLGLIFLAPGARGGGLGTQLLDDIAELARARGGQALRLAVALANPDARRLYDRLGFAHVARRARTGWNGAIIECDVLERSL
jgi:GNAT superfamily N-acetyltransferase